MWRWRWWGGKQTTLNEIYLKPTWLSARRGNKIFQNWNCAHQKEASASSCTNPYYFLSSGTMSSSHSPVSYINSYSALLSTCRFSTHPRRTTPRPALYASLSFFYCLYTWNTASDFHIWEQLMWFYSRDLIASFIKNKQGLCQTQLYNVLLQEYLHFTSLVLKFQDVFYLNIFYFESVSYTATTSNALGLLRVGRSQIYTSCTRSVLFQ